jgi:general secretion pathway protein G
MTGLRPVRTLAPRAGFSLVELLVSVAIMGVLAAVAMPLVQITLQREKEHELRLALQDIRHAIDAYKAASVSGRIAIAPGQSGYPPTLTELVAGVPDAQHPDGPHLYFLRRIPRDPFSQDRTAPAAEAWGLRSFASPPERPRAGDDVFDVYSLSSSAGLNGMPYAEW